MKKVIWMFSGQGSQYYQMGKDLYEKEPVFRECLEKGDRLARPLINESLIDIIYRPRKDRFEPFRRILFTHPAILLVEYALAQVLWRRGLRPDFLLGYSLGELTAMVVAGAVAFEDALTMAIKQAELLEYCSADGGMVAILESPELMGQHPEIFAGCEVAAYNAPRNFIVSGPSKALAELLLFLKGKGITALDLPVTHPFHSRWMNEFEAPARLAAEKLPVSPPGIPLISAEKGGLVENCSALHLWEATRNCVDFSRTICNLEASGRHVYVDLGPSGGMATAVKYNLPPGSESEFLSVITPFGQEVKHLERVMKKLGGGTG
ncbi:MAG: acyltransferase domain-containing protein [Verrucomicrobiae bacterium]|nr:acyltransferase domain-containing protein [Verrucomicrobiae bacterium]